MDSTVSAGNQLRVVVGIGGRSLLGGTVADITHIDNHLALHCLSLAVIRI